MREIADDASDENRRVAVAERLVSEGLVCDAALQRVLTLTHHLFEASDAVITIVGSQNIWSTNARNDALESAPRAGSFASLVVARDEMLVVADAQADAGSLLLSDAHRRFRAGAPLRTSDGLPIGALCIAEDGPRSALSAVQRHILSDLANIASSEIERRHAYRLNGILQGFAQTVGAALLSTDERGAIVYLNPAAEKLLGYGRDELIGRDITTVLPERFVGAYGDGIAGMANGAISKLSGKTIETIVVGKDGSEIPVDLGLSLWRDADGLWLAATMRDITERRRKEERLSRLAYLDPLTGLARATRFLEGVYDHLAATGSATVLVLDLDGLQTVNDDLGHKVGDALIRAVAVRLVGAVPTSGRLARWSGRVFVAMLPHHDPLKVRECASDIEMALAEPFEIDGQTIVVGSSIGAAMAPDHASAAEDLVAAADLALQRTKGEAGSRFKMFERTMQMQNIARRALRDEVRRALGAGELTLHYQSQVSLATGTIVGAEALLRWHHPTHGLLTPDAFIPAMDHSALALQTGRWALDQACRQIAEWRAQRRPTIRVSVNLFAAQLRFGGLVGIVADLLSTYAIADGELELEIRETIANQDDDGVIRVLRDLRDLGVGIALDDFGTGYASLSTLKRLPVSTIKIDGSFVRGLDAQADPRDGAITSAILGVGRDLGLDVVAEGIETRPQAETLKRMGCPTGQGFFYGRPDIADRLFDQRAALSVRPDDGRRHARLR